MATYNLDEQDKIDGVKSWWESYGTTIIIVISVFLASVIGTKAWNHYHSEQRAQAADLYSLLQQVHQDGDVNRVNDAAHLLTEGYPSSGYASRAALIAARANFDIKDIKTAKEKLQWVIDNTQEDELKDLARLRMAGLLLDEENYENALKLLAGKHGATFAGLYADRKGDVLVAADRMDEAQNAYQSAINYLGENNNYRNIVQMKLDDLGEVTQ
jgi:predicted negative regulator of RcsB-dependent stress response